MALVVVTEKGIAVNNGRQNANNGRNSGVTQPSVRAGARRKLEKASEDHSNPDNNRCMDPGRRPGGYKRVKVNTKETEYG